jgi:hypothetical protein
VASNAESFTGPFILQGGHMRAVIVGVALFALSGSASAQSPVVGTWEGTSTAMVDGKSQEIPCYETYTADGHFSRLCVTANRPKIKDVTGLSKDELLHLFQDLAAQYGTYAIAGNKLTRKIVAAKSPNAEGVENRMTWRLTNGVLELTADGPNGGVARFHRAK